MLSVGSIDQQLPPEPGWSSLPSVGFHSPSIKHTLTPALQLNASRAGTRTQHRPPEFGVQLDIVHIAHCERAQIVLDQQQLAWGTIYELARGVTRGMWTFEDMTEHRLRKLKGSNVQAAWKVTAVMKDGMEPSPAMRAPSEIWYTVQSSHKP